jgi:hypothetical protein
LFILYQLGLSKIVIQIISVLGGLVLFWLASKVWKISQINTEDKKFLSFWQIIVLTALNSGYWIFWITVGIPKALILDQTMIGGKFIFLMLPAIDESMAKMYWSGRHSLEGRMMFVRSTPGTPRSAFLLLDNAIVRQEEIKQRVKQGYIVRTRSDIETYEAKVNDYTRAKAAFQSGAQVISTDFFRPGNTYGTDYIVKMPNGKIARCNPVNSNCKE